MKKMLKKGFTIVELVIVVAVIAILTAVLIPTFGGIVRTAQTSSDISLVKSVNVILASENALEGKNETMEDALADVLDSGYDITKLTPTNTDNEILWDQENDRFVLWANGKYDGCGSGDVDTTNLYKLWKIYKTMPETQTYSIYWNGGALENAEVSVGFDAGTGSVANVTYTNVDSEKNVVIRTNSANTTLTINAPLDTINHYDELGTLNIVESATSSYHENGKVNVAEISKGRIVLEKGSDVEEIHVNAKVDENGDKLNEFDTVIIAYDASVDLTEVSLSRDAVEIATEGTLVVALQSGTEVVTESTELDYVWLTKQGVYEQIKISNNAESAGDVWVDDESNSVTTQKAARQIANNIANSNVTIAGATYTISVDENTRDIVIRNSETNEVATENIFEAIINGIEDESACYSSITAVENDIFNQQNPGNNYVARIGMTGYDVLGSTNGTTGALAQSVICTEEHKTVVLLKDVDLGTSSIKIPTACNFTLDLNGHTISANGYYIFDKPGGNVTGTINIINTSSTQATLSLLRDGSSSSIFKLGGRTLTIGQLDAEGNAINSNIKFIAARIDGGTSNTPAVISLGNYSNVIINGGEFDYPGQSLFTGGSANYDTPVTINGGTFGGMCISGNTPAYINGGTFNGPIDIVSSTCEVKITGGLFNGLFTVRGTDNTTAVLSIEGGLFNGGLTITTGDNYSNKRIIGGSFNFDIRESYGKYISSNYTVTEFNGVYTVVAK